MRRGEHMRGKKVCDLQNEREHRRGWKSRVSKSTERTRKSCKMRKSLREKEQQQRKSKIRNCYEKGEITIHERGKI